MKIRVLGCHGGDFYENNRGKTKRYNPSGFLVNDAVVLDAGTICGALTLPELLKLRYVFLTHAHMDHIQSLPFLSEALFGKIERPVVIVSIGEVINALQKHFFNDVIWPDFTRIPSASKPILQYQTIKVGEAFEVEGLRMTAISVSHIVPTVGFIVQDDHSAIVYSGDTWETEEIWKAASGIEQLKAIFLESSFPDELSRLAKLSGHLTPKSTYQEFQKIRRPDLPLYVYHMKPPYLAEIQKQVKAMKGRKLRLLEDGQVLEF